MARLHIVLLLACISASNLVSAESIELELAIDPAHVTCDSAADCSVVYDRCDSCSCGVAVNRAFELEYVIRLEALCENYSGPHCAKICAPQGFVCVNARCDISFTSGNQSDP